MSTVVVARKGGQLAIGSDSLITFGEMRLPPGYEANTKLFKVRGHWIGVVGSTAHVPVLQQVLSALPKEQLVLDTREAIFETFRSVHPVLKERFFLNTKEHDSDPYESSQISILVANEHGIFGVESYREVFEFERFWAIGSGRRYALGAMYTCWDRARSAREVADVGVRAGCEFDTSSAAPVRLHVITANRKKG